jgi:hypothetical protein
MGGWGGFVLESLLAVFLFVVQGCGGGEVSGGGTHYM